MEAVMTQMINYTEIDTERTEHLNQPELWVLRGLGDRNTFYTVNRRSAVYSCPFCGDGELKNQGTKHRRLLDIIRRDDDAAVIGLDYRFISWKCRNPACGRVFSRKIGFARPGSRTTRRLEDVIVRMILAEAYSYSQVSGILENRISRAAAGSIYLRRKAELEADDSESSAWYRVLSSDTLSQLNRYFWRFTR